MQPSVRTLDQIISEIRGVYDPQIKAVKTKQSLIPQAIKAEETALGAKQEQAFGDILGGARRRGLGFSGIPLGEQAKYSATEYMPALARLRQSGQEQALSLEEAILGINERMQNQALGTRQYEQQRYYQYQAQLRAEEEAKRNRNVDNLANNSWLDSLLNNGNQLPSVPLAPQDDTAMNEVVQVIGNRDYGQLQRYYSALSKSAGYGNQVDAKKLEYLQALQPGLFKNGQLNTARLNALMNMNKPKAAAPSQPRQSNQTIGGQAFSLYK